jgi:hypothetical protein
MESKSLSPEEWAKAVGEFVRQRSKERVAGKIVAELTINENARRRCIEICISLPEGGTFCFCLDNPPPPPR